MSEFVDVCIELENLKNEVRFLGFLVLFVAMLPEDATTQQIDIRIEDAIRQFHAIRKELNLP